MMKKVCFYCSLLFVGACANETQKEVTSEQGLSPAAQTDLWTSQVEVADPEADALTGAVAQETTFNGVFVIPPEHHAIVTLPIDGIVKNTKLLPGQFVRKGELLATLEDPAFIGLQQSYLENYAQTEYLEKEFLRQQTLSREEAASLKKFEQSRAEFLSVKSRRDGNASQLTLLGIDPARVLEDGIMQSLQVKAPLSGYISDTHIQTGKFVHAGDALCEIIDKSRSLLKITVYEKDLEKVQTGNRVSFRINGMGTDASFQGKIISVGQQVDPVNRSLEVYAQVNGSDSRFRPGMYVHVQIDQK